MPENKALGQVESKACCPMHRLKREGLEVAQGSFTVWPVEECHSAFQRMGLCYGNNPASPPSQNVINGNAGIHDFSVAKVSAKPPSTTIGIIGGVCWVSSVEYYRIMKELVRDRPGGLSSAQTLMFPLQFSESSGQKQLAHKGTWILITQTIPGAARRLKRAGEAFIIVASNTLNSIAETVEQEGNASLNKPICKRRVP